MRTYRIQRINPEIPGGTFDKRSFWAGNQFKPGLNKRGTWSTIDMLEAILMLRRLRENHTHLRLDTSFKG